ncbi:MAG: hypothetical protein HAW66_03030 [Shewanella sp.]|nr:hypothetical protein [Shewanella sp.]
MAVSLCDASARVAVINSDNPSNEKLSVSSVTQTDDPAIIGFHSKSEGTEKAQSVSSKDRSGKTVETMERVSSQAEQTYLTGGKARLALAQWVRNPKKEFPWYCKYQLNVFLAFIISKIPETEFDHHIEDFLQSELKDHAIVKHGLLNVFIEQNESFSYIEANQWIDGLIRTYQNSEKVCDYFMLEPHVNIVDTDIEPTEKVEAVKTNSDGSSVPKKTAKNVKPKQHSQTDAVSSKKTQLKSQGRTIQELVEKCLAGDREIPINIRNFLKVNPWDNTVDLNDLNHWNEMVERVRTACQDCNKKISRVSLEAIDNEFFIYCLTQRDDSRFQYQISSVGIAAIAWVTGVRVNWLLHGRLPEIDTEQKPKNVTPKIDYSKIPMFLLHKYLRTDVSVGLPTQVVEFLTVHKDKLDLMVGSDVGSDIDRKVLLANLKSRAKELKMNFRVISLMATITNSALVSNFNYPNRPKIDLINFCSLALIMGCNPFWLAKGSEPKLTESSPSKFEYKPVRLMQMINPIEVKMQMAGVEPVLLKRHCEPKTWKEVAELISFQTKYQGKLISDGMMIEGHRFDYALLATTIEHVASEFDPEKYLFKRAFKPLYDKIIADLKKQKQISSSKVYELAKVLRINPLELIKGRSVEIKEVIEVEPEFYPNAVDFYYRQSVIYKIRQSTLVPDPNISPNIQKILKEHLGITKVSPLMTEKESACDEQNESLSKSKMASKPEAIKNECTTKARWKRIETQCRVLSISDIYVFRILSGNPNARTIYYAKTDLEYGKTLLSVEELCGVAFVLGINPYWLLYGHRPIVEADQRPYLHQPREFTGYRAAIYLHLRDYFRGNDDARLPLKISNVLEDGCSSDEYEFNSEVALRLEEEINNAKVAIDYLGEFISGSRGMIFLIKTKKVITRIQACGLSLALNICPDWLLSGIGPKGMLRKKKSPLQYYQDVEARPKIDTKQEMQTVQRNIKKGIYDGLSDVVKSYLERGSSTEEPMEVSTKGSAETMLVAEQSDINEPECIESLLIRMSKAASARGMNLYELAMQMGYKYNIFVDLKKHKISWRNIHFALAAHVLGINPEWLEKGIGPIIVNDLKPNHVELPKATEQGLSKRNVSPQKRKQAQDKKTLEALPPPNSKKQKLG